MLDVSTSNVWALQAAPLLSPVVSVFFSINVLRLARAQAVSRANFLGFTSLLWANPISNTMRSHFSTESRVTAHVTLPGEPAPPFCHYRTRKYYVPSIFWLKLLTWSKLNMTWPKHICMCVRANARGCVCRSLILNLSPTVCGKSSSGVRNSVFVEETEERLSCARYLIAKENQFEAGNQKSHHSACEFSFVTTKFCSGFCISCL